ncbi:hypothetical protein [Pseudarcicella hirudinis]|uniref:hypothetical protein n=1 Tax=Pseudarcicella hirudinis TaxID=1079859 RepID=UPI000B82A022|nr:hypothetical protein [Pseudarcicella hirudinis]
MRRTRPSACYFVGIIYKFNKTERIFKRRISSSGERYAIRDNVPVLCYHPNPANKQKKAMYIRFTFGN